MFDLIIFKWNCNFSIRGMENAPLHYPKKETFLNNPFLKIIWNSYNFLKPTVLLRSRRMISTWQLILQQKMTQDHMKITMKILQILLTFGFVFLPSIFMMRIFRINDSAVVFIVEHFPNNVTLNYSLLFTLLGFYFLNDLWLHILSEC